MSDPAAFVTGGSSRAARRRSCGVLVVGALLVLVLGGLGLATRPAHAASHAATSSPTENGDLPLGKAIVLGAVEGITEFLPVSSTGHLLVAERLMDVGTSSADAKDAADAYTVIIQLGAIVAVLLISWRRVLDVLQGLVGRSPTGRRLLVNLLAAFVPAAVVGVAFNDVIDEHLLRPIPVALAWLAGGVAIIALASRYRRAGGEGLALDELDVRHALVIGVAQSLALWPGVSRSLVTILAAVLLGYSLKAAVEFSFLLGLCTLGAACFYSLAKDGSLVFDRYGTTAPVVGLVVAFVAAAASVTWMVGYLTRHDLRAFALYRLAAGVGALALVAANVI